MQKVTGSHEQGVWQGITKFPDSRTQTNIGYDAESSASIETRRRIAHLLRTTSGAVIGWRRVARDPT